MQFRQDITRTIAASTSFAYAELILVRGQRELALSVKNEAASAATNGFTIDIKPHKDSDWVPYLAGSDFDTATENLPFVSSTGPHELGAGATAGLRVRFGLIYAVRIGAKLASGTGNVVIRGTAA